MEKTAIAALKKLSKKDKVKLVMNKLEPVLEEYKREMGKKAFKVKLKKAAKLFADGVPKKAAKKVKAEPTKKAVK